METGKPLLSVKYRNTRAVIFIPYKKDCHLWRRILQGPDNNKKHLPIYCDLNCINSLSRMWISVDRYERMPSKSFLLFVSKLFTEARTTSGHIDMCTCLWSEFFFPMEQSSGNRLKMSVYPKFILRHYIYLYVHDFTKCSTKIWLHRYMSDSHMKYQTNIN